MRHLQDKIRTLHSETTALGWQQRSALISHVYANNTLHGHLNEARNAWQRKVTETNVYQWLIGHMLKYRDEWGEYTDPDVLISEVQDMYDIALKKEEYEMRGY